MKPPIIVDENGPVYVYEALKDAELDLEPIDVRENRYVAYDSEGRLLRLIPTEPLITIESAEDNPTHSTEARELLMALLEHVGHPRSRCSSCRWTTWQKRPCPTRLNLSQGPSQFFTDLFDLIKKRLGLGRPRH